jgi:hypothetical protein
MSASSTTTKCIICRKRKRDEMDDPNKTLKKKIKLSIEEVAYPKFMDADDLEVIQQGCVNILTHKRVRKETKHKDDAYFQEVKNHKKLCGKNGGFVKGAGYHYDREF